MTYLRWEPPACLQAQIGLSPLDSGLVTGGCGQSSDFSSWDQDFAIYFPREIFGALLRLAIGISLSSPPMALPAVPATLNEMEIALGQDGPVSRCPWTLP